MQYQEPAVYKSVSALVTKGLSSVQPLTWLYLTLFLIFEYL
jgi:hypothetical protein